MANIQLTNSKNYCIINTMLHIFHYGCSIKDCTGTTTRKESSTKMSIFRSSSFYHKLVVNN